VQLKRREIDMKTFKTYLTYGDMKVNAVGASQLLLIKFCASYSNTSNFHASI